jgi:mono/diheme cytochrome c family protein
VCDLPPEGPANLARMFRLCAILIVLGLAIAACGGGDDSSSSSSSSSSSTQAAGGGDTASAQGKQIFSQNCKGCHTLKDAGATGSVGPNLDDLKPDKQRVVKQVNNGGGPMPAFKGKLSDTQIDAVSTYVSTVAGKS